VLKMFDCSSEKQEAMLLKVARSFLDSISSR
jgi:hypothetical protein